MLQSTGERGDLSCGWAFLRLTDDTGNPLPNRYTHMQIHQWSTQNITCQRHKLIHVVCNIRNISTLDTYTSDQGPTSYQ